MASVPQRSLHNKPFILMVFIQLACFLLKSYEPEGDKTPRGLKGELKAMQLLFYARRNDKDIQRLEVAIHKALPGCPIELFKGMDKFRERLCLIVEPDSIAILVAGDRNELQAMQFFRVLLPEIYVILIIPDWEESTIRLAHLLLPRFLTHKKDNFDDLIQVLKKMGQIPR